MKARCLGAFHRADDIVNTYRAAPFPSDGMRGVPVKATSENVSVCCIA